ncbi:DUF1826 domain-containing protein [Rubellimicrobium sp. CFH 75288]|uniref:DUF1826 domain-containing protein n=1 Tax=Rubellimicrobium sp. CFH 75288 TaxID=2697034 RepID=UPI00352AAD3B
MCGWRRSPPMHGRRFHVDRARARLLCTLRGPGTELALPAPDGTARPLDLAQGGRGQIAAPEGHQDDGDIGPDGAANAIQNLLHPVRPKPAQEPNLRRSGLGAMAAESPDPRRDLEGSGPCQAGLRPDLATERREVDIVVPDALRVLEANDLARLGIDFDEPALGIGADDGVARVPKVCPFDQDPPRAATAGAAARRPPDQSPQAQGSGAGHSAAAAVRRDGRRLRMSWSSSMSRIGRSWE